MVLHCQWCESTFGVRDFTYRNYDGSILSERACDACRQVREARARSPRGALLRFGDGAAGYRVMAVVSLLFVLVTLFRVL